ncbi:MAG: NADH-quinone oxidoreductase subunit NuoE [Anaerolineaceae bacterium]|nr:NADH-quinone oxidoreductase subunit NuoE [Anaerolineaceae bacterium]
MTRDTQKGIGIQAAVDSAIKHYGLSTEELIPILTDVNRTIGYLPNEALEEIGRRLKVPKSQLFAVTSFYHMLSTEKRGRHVIQFCESAPCHVVGGKEVWDRLLSELNIQEGETTPDDNFSLITTSCLGLCGIGPVVVIDEDIYGNVYPDQIPEILAHYK